MKKIKTLYCPFVFWNICFSVISIFLGIKKFSREEFSISIAKIILTIGKDGFFLGATWFLGSLFVVSVSYKVMDAYMLVTGEIYTLPVYSEKNTTVYEVSVEMDSSYENTAGPLAKYGDVLTVAGLAVSAVGLGAALAGGAAAAAVGTAATVGGFGISAASFTAMFQKDEIPDMPQGVTKYTITSRYYYQDPVTNELTCARSTNTYYYVDQTRTLYDGNRRTQISPKRGNVRNEKI